MIYGIGTDILFVPRIAAAMQRFGARFSDRILATEEREQLAKFSDAQQITLYVAKRFAAKEAFAKALGSGIGKVFTWHDLAITNDASGKPNCIAAAPLATHLSACGVVAKHVSLSDERDYVLAFVTLETA
jgi:holo-[acyl-carrier protein] synthase